MRILAGICFAAVALLVMETGVSARQKQSAAPMPLVSYAGHYPFDILRGLRSFQTDSRVKSAIEAASPDNVITFAVRQQGVHGPISLIRNSIVAGGCQPHSCDRHNWLIVMDTSTQKALLCYFNANLNEGAARWFRKMDRVPGPPICDESAAAQMISAGL